LTLTLIIFVADAHSNSRLGLCPPVIPLEDGGEYRPSRSQREVWSAWLKFWDEMDAIKRQHSAIVLSHFVGDWMDMNAHDHLDPITRFEPDVLKVGEAVIRRAVEVSDLAFIYRGTPAHVGEHCKLEEMLALNLATSPLGRDKIEPDEQRGTASWASWWGECGGVTFDVQHHPVTMGLREHTYRHAALRQSQETELIYSRQSLAPPDWCIRAHGHRFVDSGEGTRPRVIFLPSWKLSVGDAYLHRKGKSHFPSEVGGAWFLVGDGQTLDWGVKLWRPKRAARKKWKYTR